MSYYSEQRSDDRSRAARLQTLLARHEAELTNRKQLLRDDISSEPGEGRGTLESSADNFARDVGAALLEASARTVRSIEDALRRLKSGAYGSCLDCGSPIPPLRLQALPFAERCRECQYDPGPRQTPLLA